jgi:ketosteroid isomerase-like protein
MSDQALVVVERLWNVLNVNDVVAGLADAASSERVRATLMELAEPDFEVSMLAPEELGGTAFSGRGADGFRQVWEEWVEPFEAFGVESERRIESGDEVVDLVRLTATSKTGGVQVEHAGAAVWTVRHGRIVRVIFYLERRDALEAVGLEPDRPASD